MKRELKSAKAPAPIGPYSQAVESGAVYCSGQLGVDPTTGNLEEGIVAQTRRALSNLEEVLKSAGMGLGDIVRTTVFMTNLSEFPRMNDEYARHFAAPFPARSTVQVSGLPKGAKVEVDAVAARG